MKVPGTDNHSDFHVGSRDTETPGYSQGLCTAILPAWDTLTSALLGWHLLTMGPDMVGVLLTVAFHGPI